MGMQLMWKRLPLAAAAIVLITANGTGLAQQRKAAGTDGGGAQMRQAAPVADPLPRHALEGRWFVTWVARSTASQMVITQIQSAQGVTTFSGQIAAPAGGETCSLNGNVVDLAKIAYSDGYEQRNVPLPVVVFMRGQCRDEIIQFELFGMPNGKILMNGRATIVETGGARSYEPVALARP